VAERFAPGGCTPQYLSAHLLVPRLNCANFKPIRRLLGASLGNKLGN
jgi:hypothetical protein